MNDFMPYLGEFIGTALLILLGDGVVANVILKKTKGNGAGWVVITIGWATAVLIPALIFSGGNANGTVKFTNQFNPALTLALALTGQQAFGLSLGYIVAQMLGAFLGAVAVWFMHKDHFDATAVVATQEDYVSACEGFCSIEEVKEQIAKGTDIEEAKKKHAIAKADSQATMLAVFCTGPAIRNKFRNFCCEVIATFVLLFMLTAGLTYTDAGDAVGLFAVWALILALGMSLGGTTGYSLNPARDLSPRIAHAVLPIKGKGKSDWGYAWVPTVGPIVGAILGAVVSLAVFGGFTGLTW